MLTIIMINGFQGLNVRIDKLLIYKLLDNIDTDL